MEARAPRHASVLAGAEFRKSLQRVFDEAKDKHFGGPHDFGHMTRGIVALLRDAQRPRTGRRTGGSWAVRLPDGRAASSRVALPRHELKLSRETTQRLRRADSDKEFLGILLAAQHEQMAKKQTTTTTTTTGERRRKRRARDVVLTSPEQASPAKKTRGRKTGAGASSSSQPVGATSLSVPPFSSPAKRRSGTAAAAAAATSQEPQRAVSEGPAELTLTSGRKVRLVRKASKEGGGQIDSSSRATASSSLAPPQTPTPRRQDDGASDDSPSDSADDTAPTSNASSPMDTDDPDADDAAAHEPATGAQKLTRDMTRLLQSLTRSNKNDGWADKPAMLEWLTLALQRLSQQTTTQTGPGRASRLDSIARHMPDRLAAVDPDRWTGYLAALRRLCRSPAIHDMDYEQRLLRVVAIVYLAEEVDAVARGEWARLEKVLGLCSVIAEAIGPEDEVVDDERKNRWILARRMDLASLRTLMAAGRRCEGLGM
ncbi:hypothetical protein E4U42_000800 [Claviceps africana]|uniref:Uncharacterized protein n=1 Tax=Claviceps africana TaxID=83212 RepID=A0A8K0NKD0_9HYPO|nr:hypothetical protein E4U42_000800 [Claviceps africana]